MGACLQSSPRTDSIAIIEVGGEGTDGCGFSLSCVDAGKGLAGWVEHLVPAIDLFACVEQRLVGVRLAI